MAVIITEQAPSAKPISVVQSLTTTYQNLITVNSYEIPVVGFDANTRVAPGVAEITSPITVSNVSASRETFDVRIIRDNTTYTMVFQVPVEPSEIVYIPFNGQFLNSQTGDQMQIKASAGGALNVYLSYTEGQAEENSPFVN